MRISTKEILSRLGEGESIAAVCKAAGISRREFNAWWRAECGRRVPKAGVRTRGRVSESVEIARDRLGVPHITASTDEDLFFGFGLAMAQDRLWQLDWLRRRAHGTLAEVVGQSAYESDLLARTVGLNRIARDHLHRLPRATAPLLEAFSNGINSVIDASSKRLPIEFDLLGCAPEPWRPVDTMAVWVEFQWYLTGRFPVIAIPELARRALGEGPLYEAFLIAEADDESIVPAGAYPKAKRGVENVGASVGDPDDGRGSNNWAVAGHKSTTGKPLVASDPHIAFGALSCWYEAHLCGGSFNVAGASYIGVPAFIIGRTEGVAWGVTNNICSQRDLYQERSRVGLASTQSDDGRSKKGLRQAQPAEEFFFDGKWEPAREVVETIKVKDGKAVRKTIRFSRNGPIVDEILPAAARGTGRVSLKWMGATECDEITVFLKLNRAQSADELRDAVRDWRVPTWSLVFGDTAGHIGYQCVGRIPVRKVAERGYRPGWDPRHQWTGSVPYEQMPAIKDPESGWVRSANNRTAPPDFPYPLSGTWGSGHRARRIRELLEAQPKFSLDDFTRMHHDFMNMRAVEWRTHLIKALRPSPDARIKQALGMLEAWDCRMTPDSAAAAIFEAFFRHWSSVVAEERFAGDAALAGLAGGSQSGGGRMTELAAGAVGGLALELLGSDRAGWFTRGRREQAIERAMRRALGDLERRMGADMNEWEWGNVHRMALRHPLSGRGDLGKLLDRGGQQVGGNAFTVGNTGAGPDYEAPFGANYRFKADLASTTGSAWTVDHSGQSGHPGSEHYCDQTLDWIKGRYHEIPLDPKAVRAKESLVVLPASRK
ncbi:MAG: penicillin acylase family protein [Chloroflexi bacterium]|nr:penicillin acylase family protein [Chloroflexota bacterium]